MIDNAILKANVSHKRFGQKHEFSYRVFYLCLNLNNLKKDLRQLTLLSAESPNVFSFRYRDFLQFGGASIAENFRLWLQSTGEKRDVSQLFLIAHPRTFGYSFNPISIFLYQIGQDWFATVEVDNTFGEAKMFPLGQINENGFVKATLPKDFYVSPFLPLDTEFTFTLSVKDKEISFGVASHKNAKTLLDARLQGHKLKLSNVNLLKSLVQNPHVTAKVIGGIHYEALRLYLKRIPFIRKTSEPHKQRDYYDRKHHSKHVP